MEFKAMPRWQDPSRDPNLQPLEVCEYTTDSKCISVLNRKLCIKNQPNPLGKINYLSINFADVIDSWYGLGVSQLLAGEQRLQQGIINSRLDELALRLSGTFLRTRGANTPTQQLRMRPGGIIDTDDAKGIQMIQYPPALVDAFTEVDASDSRAQRRTGANQLVTQGTAPSAGQLGRTSAGIQTANAALGARISYWMDQITTLMFVPALEAIMEMNQKYMPEDEIKDFFADELREAFSGDALDVKNGSFKFETLAGGKLKQRMSMMQIAPELMQFFQLQPVLEAIADQQMKVDWMQFIQTVLDATGWPGAQKFITKMTPQEIKAQQQKSQMMLQNSQIMLKHQAAMQEIEQKGKAQIGSNISKGIVDHQNPETKANALSKLYEMYMNEQAMAQGDQDAEGEGEAGQTGGEEGAGEEGGEP
jgi:hypothetical protein